MADRTVDNVDAMKFHPIFEVFAILGLKAFIGVLANGQYVLDLLK